MIFFIIFVVVFLSKTIFASDTLCHTTAYFYNSACFEWLNKKNSYDLIQTGKFREFMREEDCCPSLTIALYDILFVPNSFIFNSFIKIDSLFYTVAIEITKLPTYIEWVEKSSCRTITIPKSLFSLLNEAEQDSLYSIVKKDRLLSITDSLFEIYEGTYRYNEFPPVDIIACSIRANIEQEPNGKYTLTLNNTRYKMVELSNNHYVLRKEKEKKPTAAGR